MRTKTRAKKPEKQGQGEIIIDRNTEAKNMIKIQPLSTGPYRLWKIAKGA